MNWNKFSLLEKIAGAIMAITVVFTVTLSYIQYRLYTNNFQKIFSNLEDSVMTMKRDGAHDILREVKIATEGSLARGEYEVFTKFARQQKAIGEIQAFSFYGRTGKVELSSDAGRINQQIALDLWKKAEKTNEMFLNESTGAFTFYYPLHVDADLRRLHPTWNVGELYGVLCLEFSKNKINEMSAAARNDYAAASWRVGCVVAVAVCVALCIAFGLALLLCRAILRPLRACMDAVKGLTGEDFSDVAKTAGNDEVAQMTRVINATVESMQTRVNRMLEVLGRVAKGDYSQQLQVVGKDALAHLAEGMKTFFHEKQAAEQREADIAENDRKQAAELRRKVDGLLSVVGAAAEGDLTKEVSVEGDEPVDELADGIGKMLGDLSHLIGQVTESTAQFKEGSRVIAESAQSLANGAQNQSASVEEMTAAIESLAHSFESVTRRAQDANQPGPANQRAGRTRRRRGAKIDPGHDADPRELAADRRDQSRHLRDRQPNQPPGPQRRHRGRAGRRTRHGIRRGGRRSAETGRALESGRPRNLLA